MAQPAPSFAASHVAGYELVAPLGAGGMGVVFKAHDLQLQRTVALKFLASEPAGADRQRLTREARAAAALDHPNIAAVHAIGEADDGRLFIVMAYYEGETLAAKLAHGPMQPAKAANWMRQIARGLAHAHAHGIVHRDMKPSNVIITD